MLCTLGDPLLAPALDAGEVGLREIDGHPGRLSVDIGEVSVQGHRRGIGARTSLNQRMSCQGESPGATLSSAAGWVILSQ